MLRFTKMHGLGNDFMVLNLVTQSAALTPRLIGEWADRRTGVGFDQLLTLSPPRRPDADFQYRIYNADGSEAEQCGNGARCMARFIIDEKLSPKPVVTLQSLGGVFDIGMAGDDAAFANLPAPKLDAASVPFIAPYQANGALQHIDVDGQMIDLLPVSMGNPHAVTFVDNIQEAPVESVGRALGAHPAFPEGVNVGFCQVVDRGFARLRVFERGVGETQSCGSGACAAMAAGHTLGHLDNRAKLSLPGGKVKVAWEGGDAPIRLTGPVMTVYSGTIAP